MYDSSVKLRVKYRHVERIWGLPLTTYASGESPIHFYCVLHAVRGVGGPDSM